MKGIKKMLDRANLNLDVWETIPFRSNAEMIECMKHPAYRDSQDDAFRDAVATKLLAMTNSSVKSTVYGDIEREVSNTSASGSVREVLEVAQRTAEDEHAAIYGSAAVKPRDEKAQRAADLREAERQLAMQYGAGAIRPSSDASTY